MREQVAEDRGDGGVVGADAFVDAEGDARRGSRHARSVSQGTHRRMDGAALVKIQGETHF